jgi:hypothetical protein
VKAQCKIEMTEFDGFEAVEITTAKARMVIVSGTGPRIASLQIKKGRDWGRNLLFWDFERKYNRKDWALLGGHRVWNTRPGADEAEETYESDTAPCDVRMGKNKVTVTASALTQSLIQKSITVTVVDDMTFTVDNAVENIGEMLWSGGVWALTCTLPGKRSSYGIPLGDGSAWDVFAIVVPKAWAGHVAKVNDPQISLTEDCLVVNPKGVKAKRMVQAPQGMMGMTDLDEKISFIVETPYEKRAQYPFNSNVAFFVGPKNFMVEMEHMGAERTVYPGETLHNVQTWALRAPIDWKTQKGLVKI